VDDPFVFGQIAAANALSDVYAMGGDPVTALNVVGFPKGKMPLEVLAEILRGGAEKAREAGVVVIGGHSIIDPEVKYGMAVTGVIHPAKVIRNVGSRPGDVLVLTKALGTGIVSTALKRGAASPRSVKAAVASMARLNKVASLAMRRFTVHACSDVTGYGLLGHAQEMAAGTDVTIELHARALPLLPGALRLAELGHLTGGCRRNREYLTGKVSVDPRLRQGLVELAFDPQTSGGLLIALPQAAAVALVAHLHDEGIADAAIVGRVTAAQDVAVRLL
jgi:selenide,water dikinase